METTEFRAGPGEASYATLAHVINATCAPDPPVGRQQVYAWHTRIPRIMNMAGAEFPQPVRTIPDNDRRQGQPSVFFSTSEVLHWYGCGVAE